MNPYLLLGAALFYVASLGGAYWKGGSANEAEWQSKIDKQKIEALQKEVEWKGKIDEVAKQHRTEIGAVARQRDAALASLRNRPETRLPEPSRAACAGSTGRELSKPDAGFLVRLASEADELRASLRACQSYIAVVKGTK